MGTPTILILAAGKGTRMKSEHAKVLHRVGGVTMLELVVRTSRQMTDDVRVVVGHQSEDVKETTPGATFIEQTEQLGTGHAVMAARDALSGADGPLLILPGDVPLIRAETLEAFSAFHSQGDFQGSVLTAEVNDPTGYGRIVRRSEYEMDAIVEHRDATGEILRVREINSGIYVFEPELLFEALDQTRTDNAQKEYYLTDVVAIMSRNDQRVGAFRIDDPAEVAGINSRSELARVDRILRDRKCEALMASGVTIMDPASAWIDIDVEIGPDSILHPSVTIEGSTVLGAGVTVRSGSRITDSRIGDGSSVLDGCVVEDSELHEEVSIGPYARLRPGAILERRVKLGNFVEVKKSRLGEGVKAGHLAYIGDATIGKDVNVGAGVIFCNYDGARKNPTVIEDGVFLGSDAQLVAPVRVGKGAYVAAGSTITEDVPAGSLAIGRGRQVVKDGWVERKKSRSS